MKKHQPSLHSLKFRKTSIANLYTLQGGGKPIVSDESSCCSEPPVCPQTVTTRPDSLADA
ncbi:hypothetical protein KORDIASMS9_00673 [Kordia sp. SMS9]|uniref:hypothetical protein n=1 Tax=Kordia sp. SMS9 TaxID=2282170 RepID=UPI000E0DBA3D|nr:hypothetical protein [Kordia sp. SMS9]AXG68458.1 hypothetical protein KORDIASMS9_00673 [Kordia sp. SMS9]